MIKKLLLVLWVITFFNVALAATPQKLLTGYEAKSGKASSSRGEQFFSATHDKEWNFATCMTSKNIFKVTKIESKNSA
jgi:hypothetical protein